MSEKGIVGPSNTARLFNPFSNSGISVSAPAPACLPAWSPACLAACTNKLMEAERPHLVACMDVRGRPRPVRNRRYPKIQRRRRRQRRQRGRMGQEDLRRLRRRRDGPNFGRAFYSVRNDLEAVPCFELYPYGTPALTPTP